MKSTDKVIIEVMYKARYCLICQYMDEAVKEILPEFGDHVEYRRVDILQGGGKKRFLDLSVGLFGKDGVYKNLRIAPVPSLFLDGELHFDAIPPRPMLFQAIEEAVSLKSGGEDHAENKG